MKYKLTDNKKTINGVTVYQIEALKDFGYIKKGYLGGWIESEANLSQGGNCCVSGDAVVYGYAEVFGNAEVSGYAEVYGSAKVYGYAEVSGYAEVFGNAEVYGNAKVYRNAGVFERAMVYGNAEVYGSAIVYGDTRVSGNAQVYGIARVSGNSKVFGDARVYGDAIVSESQYVSQGHCIADLSKNMKESIRCQTGLGVFNNEVIVYKQVLKSLRSFHDKKFVYKVGEIVEAENPEISNASCASGLHGSTMNYWNDGLNIKFSTFLAIKVQLEDVITVQQGKIRFKKGLVLGTYDIEL